MPLSRPLNVSAIYSYKLFPRRASIALPFFIPLVSFRYVYTYIRFLFERDLIKKGIGNSFDVSFIEGGIPHHEDSYASDCRSLESYLETLRSYSFSITGGVARPVDLMENELIVRWREIMAALPGRRESGNDDYHGYSERQFEYLTMIVEQALGARDALLQVRNSRKNTRERKIIILSLIFPRRRIIAATRACPNCRIAPRNGWKVSCSC